MKGNFKWSSEVRKYLIPVEIKDIKLGIWKNVTREQNVRVEKTFRSTELGIDMVEYYYEKCEIGKYYYSKPLSQFLRSYKFLR